MLCQYGESRVLFLIMLNVIVLSIIFLNVIMLSLIMLSVVALFLCLKENKLERLYAASF
jgi:hypothetical protein